MSLTIVKEIFSQSLENLYYSNCMRDFGEYIKSERRRRGLSQERLAELAGVTGGAISKIEAGYRDIRVSTLVGLAKALRIQAIDLIMIYEGKNPPPSVDEEEEVKGIALGKIDELLKEVQDLKALAQLPRKKPQFRRS